MKIQGGLNKILIILFTEDGDETNVMVSDTDYIKCRWGYYVHTSWINKNVNVTDEMRLLWKYRVDQRKR